MATATASATTKPAETKTEDQVKVDGATEVKGTDEKKAPQKKGKYTVLEQITVSLPTGEPAPEGGEKPTRATDTFVKRGEVEARSKNDAIRQAFNEGLIEGQGTYAAVTSRSFAPVKVEPKQRTALTWS
jgi:hypothetical protein